MKKKYIRNILIAFLTIMILLLISVVILLPGFVKRKLIRSVNEKSEFRLDIADLSLGLHHIHLNGVKLRHKEDKETYIKNKGYQTDWISCKIDGITISGIQWKLLFKQDHFMADSILIDGPGIYVFRDKRIADKYKYKALPAALLRKAGFTLTIPVVKIKKAKVIYEEVVEKTGNPVTVSFSELYATCYDLSTDPAYLSVKHDFTIDAEGMALDSIKTSITYIADLLSENDQFSLKGNMKAFSAKWLNQCVSPATDQVLIEDGFINYINFSFTADEDRAKGKIDMDYKELKIKVLKKEDKTEKNAVLTFLANVFVRNKDKKEDDPSPHAVTGDIYFKRRKDRFIFNYWWNAFKSGVVESVVKVEPPKPDAKKK